MRWRALLAGGGALLSVGPIVAIVVSPSPSALGACLGPAGPAGGTLSYAQLEGLWVQGGGLTAVAPTAAAIAMAESGGKAQIQQGQPYATTGWGYWQITPGNSEPQFGVNQAMLVPINNARAAVAKYTAAGGFSPWTTYTSGAYLAFMQGGSPQSVASDGCGGGGGSDPIPGFSPSRDDMGVDACGKPGMPIIAPAQSTLVLINSGWYAGQPLMLLQFTPPLAGTYQGDEFWYVAEQIIPASTAPGTVFAAGQPVATYAPSGTCVELGWGSPSTSSLTLVPGDANPAAGALTPEAESFKRYFGIPWVGQSP